MNKVELSKRKPPKGAGCDLHVNASSSFGKPVVRKCGETATVAVTGLGFFETFLCEGCSKIKLS